MPVIKAPYIRIKTFVAMMRKGQYPNAKKLSAEMNKKDEDRSYSISSKTLSRDVKTLQKEYDAPIFYDYSRQGYYLSNIDWNYTGFIVEPTEMQAAILAERVAGKFFPGAIGCEITDAVNTLMMKNENGMDEHAIIDNLQILPDFLLPEVDGEIFTVCYKAWEEKFRLRLTCVSDEDIEHKIIFEPYILAWEKGTWLLKGLVLRDNGERYNPPQIRIQPLHRIKEAVKLTEGHFYLQPNLCSTLKEKRLCDMTEIPQIEMTFKAPFMQRGEEICIARKGTVVQKGADFITVRLNRLSEQEALALFFETEGNAIVQAPASLREKIRKIAGKILNNHAETVKGEP